MVARNEMTPFCRMHLLCFKTKPMSSHMRSSEPGRELKQGLVLLLTHLAILRSADGVSCPLANSVRAGDSEKSRLAHMCA